jgi:hypothetical protein
MLLLMERKPMGVGAAVVHADQFALDSMWVAPTSNPTTKKAAHMLK